MKKLLLFSLLVLSLSSCKTYNDEEIRQFDQKIEEYLKKKNIDCERSSSGLYYKILNPGTGRNVRYRDIVTFKYKGTFLDGEVFDDPKEPVEFEVSKLIACWKEIMLELKPGAKVFMVSPPQLGYGSRELDDIPPNSILVFEMEIIEVK